MFKPRLPAPPAFARHLPLTLAVALLAACSSPKLPEGSETVSLVSAGMTATLTAPKGGAITKLPVTDAAQISWGDLGLAGQLTVSRLRISKLECPSGAADCEVVESKVSGILYSAKRRGTKVHSGVVHFVFGDKTEAECRSESRNLDDAKRLFAACQTVAGAGGTAVSTTNTTGAALPAPATVELETLTVAEKASSGPLKWTIRAPKGWASTTTMAGGRMFTDPAAKTAPLDAITVTVSPHPMTKSLAQAEAEAKRLDSAGLDTIADKKTLTPKTFQVATAPRGKAQIENVFVFANGKKQGVYAQCYGPAKRKSTMEEICGSLTVE